MDILAITAGQTIVTVLFVTVCVLLVLVILLQKGRGGGLAGAFGGAGGHSAFGAKTGDVFTWVTVALTFLFVVMAVIGVYTFVPPPVPQAKTAQVAPADGAADTTADTAESPAGEAATTTQPGN